MKTTTAWSSRTTIRPAMPGTFSPSLYATYPPKPAVGPALRRFATLEDLGNSSNQASGTSESRDKPNPRMVIHTPRTATSRAPKDGTTAPPKGKASGVRSASRNHGPSTAAAHAAAMLDVWPQLSAPRATIFDQHDDSSHNATMRPDLAEGDHPGDM